MRLQPIIGLAAIAIAACANAGPPRYFMEEMTGLSQNTIAFGLSDETAIGPIAVGQSFSVFTSPTLSYRAVLWTPDASAAAFDLQTIAEAGNSTVNRAQDVSPNGLYVVGYNSTAPIRARRWTLDPSTGLPVSVELLEPLPGDGACEAVGVNSRGVAVGYSGGAAGPTRPCYWAPDQSAATPLALPPGSGGFCLAREISDPPTETIVGRNDMSSSPTTRAIRWRLAGGGYGVGELLALPPETTRADAIGVSPDGAWIVGAVDLRLQQHASAWNELGEWHDLGAIPGNVGNIAYDRNVHGVAVGHTSQGLSIHRATLYVDGAVHNLNDLVVNNPAIGVSEFLHVATAINADGSIVGRFGEFATKEPLFPIGARTFLLRPVGCELPGDFDSDGDVDLADLGALLADFGCAGECPGDIDGDGQTDLGDLGLILANFGAACP